MSGDPQDGADEPTVVGYRPARGGAAGAFVASPEPPRIEPPPLRAGPRPPPREEPPRPAATGQGPAPDREAGTAELAVVEEPREPEDLLAAAAAPLLALVAEIRNAVTNADVDALRRATVEEIKAFELRAVRFGSRAGDVTVARYALCAMLDETVMTTPWGNASNWSAHSLLNQFHGETWGGEKVFAILDRVKGDPDKYLALIKLIALCLAFGFEGRYRVVEGGRYQIDALRDELHRMLAGHLRPVPPALSPQVEAVKVRRRLRRYVPNWVFFSVAAACLVALYAVFGWRLAAALRPTVAAIDAVAVPADTGTAVPAADPAAPVRLVAPSRN